MSIMVERIRKWRRSPSISCGAKALRRANPDCYAEDPTRRLSG